MFKILIEVVLFFLQAFAQPAPAAAAPTVDKPLFFQIEKNGNTAYILGSYHVDIKLEQFPSYVTDKLHDATTVAVETNLDDGLPLLQAMQNGPSPVSLKSQLTADEWTKLMGILSPTGVSEAQLDATYADNAVNEYLATLRKFERSSVVENLPALDAYIQTYAIHNGKTVAFLEPAQVQVNVIQASLEDATLLKTLLDFTNPNDMAAYLDKLGHDQQDASMQLTADYFAGDVDKLYADSSNGMTPEMKKIFLDDRNSSWIPVINQMILNQGTEFIAFGAGHLGGDTGMISLLQKDGFTVTRVTQ